MGKSKQSLFMKYVSPENYVYFYSLTFFFGGGVLFVWPFLLIMIFQLKPGLCHYLEILFGSFLAD
jgi:hypothetical protein